MSHICMYSLVALLRRLCEVSNLDGCNYPHPCKFHRPKRRAEGASKKSQHSKIKSIRAVEVGCRPWDSCTVVLTCISPAARNPRACTKPIQAVLYVDVATPAPAPETAAPVPSTPVPTLSPVGDTAAPTVIRNPFRTLFSFKEHVT